MILVECFTDAYLIKLMGFPRKKIAHEGGKGNVVKKLKTRRENSIGIIDDDPGSPAPKDLSNYREKETKAGVKLLQRFNDETKRLIVISPYLEDWLLARAKANRVDLIKYKLPSRARDIHAIPRVDKNQNFQRFLGELVQKDEGFKTIKKWIKESVS